MTAPKPTEEQTAAGKLLADHAFGYGSMSEEEYANASLFYAMAVAEREAAAEQRGREAGIRDAASECDDEARLLAVMLQPTTVARCCAHRIRALLPEPPPNAVAHRPAWRDTSRTACGLSLDENPGITIRLGDGETCPDCTANLGPPAAASPPAKPLTGPELAQKYGCPPLAESGAARVPGVDAGPPEDGRASLRRWRRIALRRCDLCEEAATWFQADGGLRCDHCPKPDTDR